MKPVTDMTDIRLGTLVDIETRWGTAPERHELLQGYSDFVPLLGFIFEFSQGDLYRSFVDIVHGSRLIRFEPEDKSVWGSPIVFDDTLAIQQLSALLGYTPASVRVIKGKYRGKKQTRAGAPYYEIEFKFLVVSEADYEEMLRQTQGLIVTGRGDYECALAGGRDHMFNEDF